MICFCFVPYTFRYQLQQDKRRHPGFKAEIKLRSPEFSPVITPCANYV